MGFCSLPYGSCLVYSGLVEPQRRDAFLEFCVSVAPPCLSGSFRYRGIVLMHKSKVIHLSHVLCFFVACSVMPCIFLYLRT